MDGFEIDGNLGLDGAGTQDWCTVGGQPKAVDGQGNTDPTAFTSGSSESNWPNWTTTTGASPGSADITNVYALTRLSGGDVYTFFGFERAATTGTISYKLELNQRPNFSDRIAVPDRTVGDLRLVIEQSGSNAIALVRADRWSDTGACVVAGQPHPCWVSLGNVTGYAAQFNRGNITNLAGQTKTAGGFSEIGIDLTTLFGEGNCSGSYGTLNLRSSTSTTETSSLVDWITPEALDVPSTCPTVRVDKDWVIDGTRYANGDQPFGSAQLHLTGQVNPEFGVTYDTRSDGTHYHVGDQVTVGETVTGLPPGCANASSGGGIKTLGADGNHFTITNTVTCTYLTLRKVVVGGTATPGQWTLSATGPTPISGAGNSGNVTRRHVAPGQYTLSEIGPAGYQLTSRACTPVHAVGNTVTLAAGDDVTCTFTNTARYPVHLTKVWQNAIPGDSVNLTITDVTTGRTGHGSSTAPATTSPAIVNTFPGHTIRLGEAFTTGNPAHYATDLSCDHGVNPNADREFTVPGSLPGGTTITCTFTNARHSATLTLQKAWENGALDDMADLKINGATSGDGFATSTANGTASQTDTLHRATATIFAGEHVNLAEAFHTATNRGTYTANLTCTEPTLTYTPGALEGTYTVPTSPSNVTCTFTNTRSSSTLTLQKTWVHGAAGDTAQLRIEGPGASQGSVVAVAPGGTGPSPQTVTRPIFSGDEVTLAEVMPAPGHPENTGSYTSRLQCDQPGLAEGAGGQGGTFTVPNTPSHVTCTFTNTRTSATMVLQKFWNNGAQNDTAVLTLSAETGTNDVTATVPASGTGLSAGEATLTLVSGDTVNLSEVFGDNTGRYTANLTCDQPGLTYTAGALNGTFTVPPNPAAVTCRFTNTRTSTTMVLQKQWNNGADGDTAMLSINGADSGPGFATSTATGAASETDATHRATATVFSGAQVTLTEAFGADNTGTYTADLTCDQPTLTYTAGALDGTYTVPDTPVPVTCTFANTRTSATLTLQKAWDTSVAGDTAELRIEGQAAGTQGSVVAVAPGGTGASPQTVTRPIFSGDAVTLAEVMPAPGSPENTGSYTSTLECDQPGLVQGRGGQGGTFGVPNTPTNVTCTFTNSRTTATMVLQKSWENGATGDTAGLRLSGEPGTDTATATVPDHGNGTSADEARLTLVSGDTVTLSEVFGVDNTGTYTADLTCSDASGLTYTAGALTGTYTVPATPIAVTCRFTNSRTSETLTLQKHWNNGADGDTAMLSINRADSGSGFATSTATGAASETDTTNQATATVFSGEQVTLTEAFGEGNRGTYTADLTCDQPTLTYTPGTLEGTYTVPATPVPVTCTFANTRTSATLTLQKTWDTSVAGDTAELRIEGPTASQGSVVAVAPGGTGPSPQTVTRPIFSGDAVTLAEELPAPGSPANTGSYTSTLECDQPGLVQASGGQGGTFTVASTPTPVTCTFTNTRTSATMVLQKTWENGAQNDTADLTLSGEPGTDTETATVPASGSGVSADEATLTLLSGDTVNLAEVFGNNTGTYTANLTCNQPGLTYTAGALNGTFAVPSTPVAVSCMFTNSRTSERLTLQKHWNNGADGDTAMLSINDAESGPGFATSTATGAASETDTTHRATATVFSGEQVTLTEAFGQRNRGTYRADLTCDQPTLTYTPGTLEGTYTVPDAPVPVTCTFANTRTSATLRLQKTWENGAPGDTAELSIDGATAPPGFATAQVPPGGNGLSVDNATATVLSGQDVTLTERFGDNTGTYTANLTCDEPTLTYTAGALKGTYKVPDHPNDVTCTFSNTRNSAKLTLQKNWQHGASGDSVTLSIGGATAPPGFVIAEVPTGGNGLSDQEASATVLSGEQVTLTEAFDETNTGTYTAHLTCNEPTLDYTAGELHGTYTVPDHPNNVICTFTNTRTSAKLTLQKTWDNGETGDTAHLAIGASTGGPGVATSTATGASGPETDETHQATKTVFSGDNVNLAETLGSHNTGSYNVDLTCTDENGLTYTAGDRTGTYTVPGTPSAVTCTFTNTRTSATLTLQKEWVNGAAGDTAHLTIMGTGPVVSASNTSTSSGLHGTELDTDHQAKATVFSGQDLLLRERFGDNNAAIYDTDLTCDNPAGLTYEMHSLAGVFAMPAVPADATCTFTNTRAAATLVLQKTWVNAAAGDTAKLIVTSTDPGTNGSAISTATGATGSQTDTVNTVRLPIYAGSTVDLVENLPAGNGPNRGSYTSHIACDPSTGFTPGKGGQGGTLVVPAAPEHAVCTITNTRTSAMLTLQKEWSNGVAGDTASLSINGATSGPEFATAHVPPRGNGLSVDKAMAPLFSGETVAVAEHLNSADRGSYTAQITCDRPGLTTAANGRSGTFQVPAAPQAVTCTITNTGSHTIPSPPPPPAAPAAVPPAVAPAAVPPLATTGVPVDQFLLSALVLLSSGALLLMLARRRSSRS